VGGLRGGGRGGGGWEDLIKFFMGEPFRPLKPNAIYRVGRGRTCTSERSKKGRKGELWEKTILLDGGGHSEELKIEKGEGLDQTTVE